MSEEENERLTEAECNQFNKFKTDREWREFDCWLSILRSEGKDVSEYENVLRIGTSMPQKFEGEKLRNYLNDECRKYFNPKN